MKDRFTVRFKETEILEDLKYLSFILNKSTNRVIQDLVIQGLKKYKNEIKRDKPGIRSAPE